MVYAHRKLLPSAALLLLPLLGACLDAGDDDGDPVGPTPVAGTADITTDITSNRRLYADTVYTLKGFIHVTSGATLTIDAGTTIKGDFNTIGSSLFVLRGAQIVARGTAERPIVFTSSQPAGQRAPGDWGGLIIVGNATINRTPGTDVEVEGTGTASGAPVGGQNYRVNYSGGTTDTDNSGVLRYVRVEFAGYAPSVNNELNSFTFAAVGSGTSLSYLQSMAGLDDSFEWFGGRADADHLVSYEAGDDHFDMSEGYQGRVQYLIALQTGQLTARPGAGSPSGDPQGIENDGCFGNTCGTGATTGANATPLTTPLVSNFTLVGTGATASSGTNGGIGMMLRRGAGGYYVNGILARWPRAAVSVRDAATYARAGSTPTPDLATTDLAVRNVLFAEAPTTFEPQAPATSTTPNPAIQNSFDLAANSLVSSTAATTTLFAAFPAAVSAATTAAAFDWRPAASSPAASGGLATFTGKLATRAAGGSQTGNTFGGTAYLGAAQPGGQQWWSGWTVYSQN